MDEMVYDIYSASSSGFMFDTVNEHTGSLISAVPAILYVQDEEPEKTVSIMDIDMT